MDDTNWKGELSISLARVFFVGKERMFALRCQNWSAKEADAVIGGARLARRGCGRSWFARGAPRLLCRRVYALAQLAIGCVAN